MKIKLIVSLIIITCCSLSAYPQKSKSPKSKSPVVTEQERQLSVHFADGLKEFYSQNYALADKEFRYVLAENDKHSAAYFMLAKINAEQKEYSLAEINLQKALSLDKKNVWYMIALAEVLDMKQNYEESSQMWSKVCDLKPESEYYIYYYSQACLNAKKYNEVIKAYSLLEKLVGVNNEITRAKVEIWLHLDDVKSAVKEYDMLIANNPYEEDYYIQASNIYVANNMPEKALPYFEKVLEINPNNAEIQLIMANYYNSKGDKKSAYNAFVKVFKSPTVSIDKKLPVLRSYLMTLPTAMPTAEQYELSRILTEVHPEAVEGWAAMGSLYLKEQKYEVAANYLEKAIEIDVAQYALWQDYLYCLAQVKNYTKIIDYANDIAELFPTNSMMNYTLGVAYLNTQNPQTALKYFETALKNSFDNGEKSRIYKMMGNAYHELQNETKAQEYWQKAQ